MIFSISGTRVSSVIEFDLTLRALAPAFSAYRTLFVPILLSIATRLTRNFVDRYPTRYIFFSFSLPLLHSVIIDKIKLAIQLDLRGI